jgi:uncharacterized membrane-anchored protein
MKRTAILWLGVLATLVGVNMSVWSFEKLRTEGSVVYLELAPLDPRSLMQGDYMSLRLAVANNVRDAVAEIGYAKQDEEEAARQKADSVMRERSDESSGNNVDAKQTEESDTLRSGFVVVQADEDNVGRYVRVQAQAAPLAEKQFALPYRHTPQGVRVVTSDFFFAEGRAKEFDAAKYGEFRVDTKGRAVLTGLLDEDLKPL